MKRLAFFLLTALIVTGVTSAVQAQNNTDNDDIAVNATVLAAVDVVGVTDLEFGSVIPGTNKTVNVDGSDGNGDVTVGTFTVSGSDAADVLLEFTLPATLSDGATNTLPIDFANVNYAAWSASGTIDGSETDFDPSATTPTATLDADGITVFIGGQVQPAGGQAGGNYTGTITLTATYN